MGDVRTVAAHLRLIAAQAEAIALKVERGQVWPGDTSRALCTIGQALDDCRNALGDDR